MRNKQIVERVLFKHAVFNAKQVSDLTHHFGTYKSLNLPKLSKKIYIKNSK